MKVRQFNQIAGSVSIFVLSWLVLLDRLTTDVGNIVFFFIFFLIVIFVSSDFFNDAAYKDRKK